MSQQCQKCGPVRFEAPAVICASCAFEELERGREIDMVLSGDGVEEIRTVPTRPDSDPAPPPWLVKAWRGMTM